MGICCWYIKHMITATQTKEICERKAKEQGFRLFWIGEQRAKVYSRKGRERGELLCDRPYFPIAQKAGAYNYEMTNLRESITGEIWDRFPSERA